MAYTKDLPRKDGTTAYLVLWRQDGSPVQETFDSATERDNFLNLVRGYGDNYPPGWVPKLGFVTIEKPADAGEPVTFATHAERYLKRKSGIDAKTRADYRKLVNRLMIPWFGMLDVRDEESFTDETVALWVNDLADGERDPDDEDVWLRKPYSPKYIANLHGLLFQIMQAAVKARPALRATNPCAETTLPRADIHTDETVCFLEYDEFQLLLACLDPYAQDVAVLAVSTGARRGELFALKAKDILDPEPGRVPLRISIQRAWKEDENRRPYLGPPKSKRSRRTVAVSESGANVARRLVAGLGPEDFLFTDEDGNPWGSSKWYHRYWRLAVPIAQERGLRKRPSLHDFRHTHASWLIAANVPLPAIQRRLGHESITTTVDRYGHLVRELETEALAAIEDALSKPRLRVVS